jgi:hypothetical protein
LYVFPDRAGIIADAVHKHLEVRSYEQVATECELCELLTALIQAVYADPHLVLLYSPETLLAIGTQPSQASLSRSCFCVQFFAGTIRFEYGRNCVGLLEFCGTHGMLL